MTVREREWIKGWWTVEVTFSATTHPAIIHVNKRKGKSAQVDWNGYGPVNAEDAAAFGEGLKRAAELARSLDNGGA